MTGMIVWSVLCLFKSSSPFFSPPKTASVLDFGVAKCTYPRCQRFNRGGARRTDLGLIAAALKRCPEDFGIQFHKVIVIRYPSAVDR
jgi:hypothetical protein